MQPLRTVALVSAVALALAACGDDDGTADSADSVGSTPTTTTSTSTASTPDADPEPVAGTVTVEAGDYHFGDLPATIAAGTTLAFRNTSDVELHELVALRLPDGETRPVAELVALPKAELEAIVGGPPATVLVAPPAADGFAVVGDGTLTEPGRYLLLCAIPTGADPDEYLAAASESGGAPTGVAGGPPHLVAGMYAELEVVAG